MKQEGLGFEEEVVGDYVFIKVHTPFDRLCQEAENVRLDLPLDGISLDDEPDLEDPDQTVDPQQWLQDKMAKLLDLGQRTRNISAPFQIKCKDWFIGPRDRETFFNSAIRGLLTHYILSNIDISLLEERSQSKSFHTKKGLPYLLLQRVYIDAFILHDASVFEPSPVVPFRLSASVKKKELHNTGSSTSRQQVTKVTPDTRVILDREWRQLLRGQPLDAIRDYLGEKISFYFAWVGTLIASLVIPAVIGFCVFFYGVVQKVQQDSNFDPSRINDTKLARAYNATMSSSVFVYFVDTIKVAGDTELTPFWAFSICLWSTIFLEIWKRRQSLLALRWNVDHFSSEEPDRPQFYGTISETDLLTGEVRWNYPLKQRALKYVVSFAFFTLMTCVVITSVLFVTLYQVYMANVYCGGANKTENPQAFSANCEALHSSVVGPSLNTVSIIILGKCYAYVAEKLTDWENHRTQSQYNDALIIKLFAFQFTNAYASLFYTAFFRDEQQDIKGNGSLFNLGDDFKDSCGTDKDTCMSLLSLQLLVLMIVKPLPKFFYDMVWPFLKQIFREHGLMKKVTDVEGSETDQHYLVKELYKQEDAEFRRDEFAEKIIQYGYLVLFACSFPLAPLLALGYNIFDLRIDSNRLLWINRRPVPFRDDDIGIWLHLFNFINYFGVVTNAFLIAFTSQFGSEYLRSKLTKFMFIVGFEHLVFVVKYLLTLLIPDIPEAVRNAKTRERQLLTYMMSRVATLTADRRPPTNASENYRDRILSRASRHSVTPMDIQAVQLAANKKPLNIGGLASVAQQQQLTQGNGTNPNPNNNNNSNTTNNKNTNSTLRSNSASVNSNINGTSGMDKKDCRLMPIPDD
ncbi:anoctamin-7-like isoform X2 [Varroa destructor]|nr:anoctamin-7-like isoform X2 [Varroa destructor]